jgi:peptidoglycan/LPS O-acetylase OafA/YrhL
MVQDILEVPALSAGQWYVAIDLQLHALFVLMLWLSAAAAPAATDGAQRLGMVVVTLGTAVSLFGFNRDTAWEVWAPYFFGAYGLGALAWWGGSASRALERRAMAGLIVALTVLALIVDWRDRIALAGLTALLLLASTAPGALSRWQGLAVLNGLGKISYSVFLIHYPVLLVFDAAAARWLPAQPVLHALALIAAWAASLLAGALLWRSVESRLAPKRKRAA